jgi:site-specific DNA recombinase
MKSQPMPYQITGGPMSNPSCISSVPLTYARQCPTLSDMKKNRHAHGAKVAVGYCRVSTTGQAEQGVSLEAQGERVKAWAAAQGYTLLAVHVDAGLSGKRADNRPGLQAAIAEACRERATLVVYSLSRLARSVPDAYTLAGRIDKAGANLVLLTEAVDTTTAAGRLFFGMLAVLAQFERDLTSERTASALAHMREQGQRVSRFAPFGYRFEGGAIVADDKERAVLARIRALRGQGLSLRAIVAQLNGEGAPARGERWHLRGVQLALEAA